MDTKENTSKAVVDEKIIDAPIAENKTASTELAQEQMSENDTSIETPVSKSLTNKELIAYLSEKFPKCFIIKGVVKPLKIGIFQELAEQLVEDDKVSKTRLRQVLRHYTSSWRYLKAIKLDAKRVDLQGEEVAEIDQEQADYASKTLKESQEKFGHKTPDKFANKKNNGKTEHKNNRSTASADNKSRDKSQDKKKTYNQKHNAKFNAVKTTKKAPPKPTIKLEQVESSEVKIGQAVKVQLGNSPMDAIVKEVVGKDVSVELTSGMVVKTQTNNLYIESVKAKK